MYMYMYVHFRNTVPTVKPTITQLSILYMYTVCNVHVHVYSMCVYKTCFEI